MTKINNIKFPDLFKPIFLAPAFLIGIGAKKTYTDYKKAPPEKKRRTLVKDIVVISSATAGYAAAFYALKKYPSINFITPAIKKTSKVLEKIGEKPFFKNKVKPKLKGFLETSDAAKNAVKTSLTHLEKAVNECFDAGFTALVSIFAAFGGSALVSKYLFKKHVKDTKAPKETKAPQNQQDKTEPAKKTNAEKIASKDLKENVFNNYLDKLNTDTVKNSADTLFSSFALLPSLRSMDLPITAVEGFNISKEKDMKKRIKKTSYSLIAHTLVPTFVISMATALTGNLQKRLRIPIIAVAALAGVKIGSVVGNHIEKKSGSTVPFK